MAAEPEDFTARTYQEASGFPEDVPFILISRDTWGAKPPLDARAMHMPIRQVRFTYENLNKHDSNRASALLKCQKHFMENKEMVDIPYNFLVAEGGLIYEGRGWTACSEDRTCNRLDIAFIGNYKGEHNPPSFEMCDAANSLLRQGVREELMHPDYTVEPILTPKEPTYIQRKYFG